MENKGPGIYSDSGNKATGTTMSQGSTPRSVLLKGSEKPVGKGNLRADLDNLPCHPTCQVIVEILKNHFIKNLLTESSSVPEIYMTQFWESMKVNKESSTIYIRIDHSDLQFDVKLLRSVLRLPPHTSKTPSLSETIQFLREIGYDESEKRLKQISDILRKRIPQPWLTLYSIIINCISGRATGKEHPSLALMQFYWGVARAEPIDYTQIIMDDMIHQHQQFNTSTKPQIPFPRYTKLLISHFMNKCEKIDPRREDRMHTIEMDYTYSRSVIHHTSTTNQGIRLYDFLLTDAVKDTPAYIEYDRAQKADLVGVEKSRRRKGTTTGTSKPHLKSSTKKNGSAPPKRPDTLLRDENTDDEQDKQKDDQSKDKEKVERERLIAGKQGKETAGVVDKPEPEKASKTKEKELLRRARIQSQLDEEARIEKLRKKGEGSGTTKEPQPSEQKGDKYDAGGDRSQSEEESENDEKNNDQEESEDERSEEERSEDESDEERREDDSEEHSQSESDNDDNHDNLPQIPSPPRQSKIMTLPVNPNLYTELKDRLDFFDKTVKVQQADIYDLKKVNVYQVVDDAIEQKAPDTVKRVLEESIPEIMRTYVREKLPGLVSRLFHSTPITIQTQPAESSASALMGKLYDVIQDDPEEEDLRKALAKSMKKKQKKDDSCKKLKPMKRRHDDPDKDDEPPNQEKRRKISGTSSRSKPSTSKSGPSSIIHMRSGNDPQQQYDEIPEFETADGTPIFSLPVNVPEPPAQQEALPPPEWINPSE